MPQIFVTFGDQKEVERLSTWFRLHSGSCLSVPISCATTAGTFRELQSPCARPGLQRWSLHRGAHDMIWARERVNQENLVRSELTWSAAGFESHAWLCTCPATWLQSSHTLTPPATRKSRQQDRSIKVKSFQTFTSSYSRLKSCIVLA